MAQQRIATLSATEALGNDTRLLSFHMADGELGFVGGQYIIVDTGIPIPGNKTAKRAYSIISSDEKQGEFQLAVRRIGEGPGSNYMHHLEPGEELKFSGPWGKFVSSKDADGAQLVFATDTGITAALGLLHSEAMEAARDRVKLTWFAQSDHYFLPFQFITSRLDRIGVKNRAIVEAPAIAHPDRIGQALRLAGDLVAAESPMMAFLSGDGDVVHAVHDRLVAAGLANENVKLECFFNNPQRRAA